MTAKELQKKLRSNFFVWYRCYTSGNHIWDKDETTRYIEKENRLLRPANFVDGTPEGFWNLPYKR